MKKPQPKTYYSFAKCIDYIEYTHNVNCYSRANDGPLQNFEEEIYQLYGINDTDVFTMTADDFEDEPNWVREIADLFFKEFGPVINFIWYAE